MVVMVTGYRSRDRVIVRVPRDGFPREPRRSARLKLRGSGCPVVVQVSWPPGRSARPPGICLFFASPFDGRVLSRLAEEVISVSAHVVVLRPEIGTADVRSSVGFHEASEVVEWSAEHAAELEADANAITILGIAEWARIAAGLAVRAKVRPWPPIAHQAFIDPKLSSADLAALAIRAGANAESASGPSVATAAASVGACAATALVRSDASGRTDPPVYLELLREGGVQVETLTYLPEHRDARTPRDPSPSSFDLRRLGLALGRATDLGRIASTERTRRRTPDAGSDGSPSPAPIRGESSESQSRPKTAIEGG
jgi:hypothetical protein